MRSVSMIDVNWLAPHKARQLTVVGTEGTAYLDYIARTVGNKRDRIFEDDCRDDMYVLKTSLAAMQSCRERRLAGVGEYGSQDSPEPL